MHELGLCQAIVGAVERRAGDRPVAHVRVRVGRLHHVHPEAFEQSFTMAAQGTVAAAATADLVLLPVRWACRSCGSAAEGEEMPPTCRSCGSTDLELRGGNELLLESIRYRST